ncbi:hypothetical protein G8T76_10705 [Clostridium botulinum C/D]|nr:hypothetical protein [Clostridium botulinum]MCD3212063.1 hypothetical protein [Clostridium botulinum C/D]MCD3214878.1 hypothetical protein [Clostridium botulinum C/D]MCD3228758.1 hypothetical protein [Clostridium botulinum C/D]MCD3237583.1 hypothetical protein [Clostridium botulinum C/D]MCD3243554.1 hypothetical protein [Clostridium botulinum C/D]
MSKKTRQEELIEIFKGFIKLPKEQQMFVSGVISGLSIQHDSNTQSNN